MFNNKNYLFFQSSKERNVPLSLEEITLNYFESSTKNVMGTQKNSLIEMVSI